LFLEEDFEEPFEELEQGVEEAETEEERISIKDLRAVRIDELEEFINITKNWLKVLSGELDASFLKTSLSRVIETPVVTEVKTKTKEKRKRERRKSRKSKGKTRKKK